MHNVHARTYLVESIKSGRCMVEAMKQATISATAIEESTNDNKSLPYGLIRTVHHYLDFIGLLKYLRGLKKKGVPLDRMTVALCVFTMYVSNSIQGCADWLKDDTVRRQFGFGKENVSQKTLDRAVGILGENREGIITALWKGIKERFVIDNYDINLDGSAVVLYGPKCKYGAKGYGRDKNRGKLQVEFMVAQLASLGIPIYIKPYAGNTSDEAQYRDCIPEIGGLLSEDDLHAMESKKGPNPGEEAISAATAVVMLGAAIIADNGAASDENIERIESCGFDYVTRVKLNRSDEKNIYEHACDFEYIGDGMFCYTHRYTSSGRRTYLYLSADLLERSKHMSTRRVDNNLGTLEAIRKGELRRSDVVTIHKVPGVTVDVKVYAQTTLDHVTPLIRAQLTREDMGIRAGFFKLETKADMTPAECLRRYRRRAGVELLISSLKRTTGIKPIRVWSPESVDGVMVLALLSEVALSLARYTLKGKKVVRTDDLGNETVRVTKPSVESMVRSLNHLTLTRIVGKKRKTAYVLSNWDPVSEEIFDEIRRHEAPEWGKKKIPA